MVKSLAMKTAAAAALAAVCAVGPVAADTAQTGTMCSSGGNVIGITLDASGSVSSTDFEEAQLQV